MATAAIPHHPFTLFVSRAATAPARRRRPRLLDAAIAAGVFSGWLVGLSHGDRFEMTDLVLLAASSLPIAGWRIAPLGTFTTSTVVALGLAARGQALWPPIGPAVALYLLAGGRDTAAWSRRTTLTVAGLLTAYLAVTIAASGWVAVDLGHTVLACAAAWLAGERARLRRQQIEALHERAHRAAESATANLRLAVAEERTRIARDLHDSAGHALNVIAVRAGAARLRNDPRRALATLADIESVARQTAADIDQIVGSLRAGEANETGDLAVESPVGLASVDTLVAQHRAAGLRVSVSRQGDPDVLVTAVDQAAYRILQESLTNAARHGAGSVAVTIDAYSAGLALTVTNPVPANAGAGAGGHGIAGMRERASLLGGTLTARQHGGEFRVEARLPRTGRAA
ncbi:sensor histidine kinase [Pseudofrankia saprophytica]|uniref:sensor histidine kinase n=1 Tax=Pseudofrankia saprophytica TaxID=298655 RepID=UPI00031A37FB|nr:histidine kinase [Pseudofrankia saprophytica]